jgi:hypothetical protein
MVRCMVLAPAAKGITNGVIRGKRQDGGNNRSCALKYFIYLHGVE